MVFSSAVGSAFCLVSSQLLIFATFFKRSIFFFLQCVADRGNLRGLLSFERKAAHLGWTIAYFEFVSTSWICKLLPIYIGKIEAIAADRWIEIEKNSIDVEMKEILHEKSTIQTLIVYHFASPWHQLIKYSKNAICFGIKEILSTYFISVFQTSQTNRSLLFHRSATFWSYSVVLCWLYSVWFSEIVFILCRK